MKPHPLLKIGVKFIDPSIKKRLDICIITDIYSTYNIAGECVNIRYVAQKEFMGQSLTKTFCEVEILKSLC